MAYSSVMFVGTPPFRFTSQDCYIWNVYQGLASVLIIASVDYILILRGMSMSVVSTHPFDSCLSVFALYPRNPGIRYFVAALYFSELVTMSVGLGLAVPNLKYDEYCTIVDSPDTFLISACVSLCFVFSR